MSEAGSSPSDIAPQIIATRATILGRHPNEPGFVSILAMASLLVLTPSLMNARERWASTVLAAMPNERAVDAIVCPSTMASMTASSRAVKSTLIGGSVVAFREQTIKTMGAAVAEMWCPPAITSRTACSSSSKPSRQVSTA